MKLIHRLAYNWRAWYSKCNFYSPAHTCCAWVCVSVVSVFQIHSMFSHFGNLIQWTQHFTHFISTPKKKSDESRIHQWQHERRLKWNSSHCTKIPFNLPNGLNEQQVLKKCLVWVWSNGSLISLNASRRIQIHHTIFSVYIQLNSAVSIIHETIHCFPAIW